MKIRSSLVLVILGLCISWTLPAGTDASAPNAALEVLLLDGKAMPLGAQQASDPSLLNLNGQWLAFFSTIGWEETCVANNHYDFVVKDALAALPNGGWLGASPGSWQIIPDGQGSYAQFLRNGRRGEWDEHGIEAPKYVSGYDPVTRKIVMRIYYTGWRRVYTQTDSLGCPVFRYVEYKIGMAEWKPALNSWVKNPGPVVDGVNPWERMEYRLPDGTPVSCSFVGEQSVIYVPGPGNTPGLWHMYYQANTTSPSLRVITIHATSTDGVHWPVANRAMLNTHPPSPTATLPGGPYSVDVALVNGKYRFFGWIPSVAHPSREGLWMVSSTTPDGHAPGDFSIWVPLLYDRNGTWWHDPRAQPAATHKLGLFSPTLETDSGFFWLIYTGVRRDANGVWASIGRAMLYSSIFQ